METHPRQLQTVDVDSFFIHSGETVQENLTTETSSADFDTETVSNQEQEEISEDQIAEER